MVFVVCVLSLKVTKYYLCSLFRFNKREEAQEAISALNNVIPEGGNQPLTVRVAEEHGKQRANAVPHQFPMPPGTAVYNNVMHRGRQKFRFQNHPYGHPNKMINK